MKFWDRVSSYNFLLMVLVIWLHSVGVGIFPDISASSGDSSGLAFRIGDFLGNGLGQIAVPGFFCMSGLLFYRNLNDGRNPGAISWPGKDFFCTKWKRRFFSLLIPYLIWNLIYYIIYLIAGRASLSPEDFMNAVFLHEYNPVFWYLGQLLVLTALTPLIFLLIRNKTIVWILRAVIFLIAVFYDLFPFHLVNEDALFYYTVGAGFGAWSFDVIKKDPFKTRGLWIRVSLYALVCLILSGFLFFNCGRLFIATVSYRVAIGCEILIRLSGSILIFGLVSLMSGLILKKAGAKKVSLPGFMRCNFLVYALHYLEIRFFVLIFFVFFSSVSVIPSDVSGDVSVCSGSFASVTSIWEDLIFFFLMPVLCIMFTYFVDIVLQRFLPGVARAITGKRG